MYQEGKLVKICYITTLSVSIRSFFVPQLKYLSENGYDVTVVCSPDEKIQEILGESVKYVPITIPRGLSPVGMLKAISNLRSFFASQQFDIIQYSTPNAAFCSAFAAKSVGCKVRNYHLMGFRYLGAGRFGRTFLKMIERMTCRCSTSIECVSHSNLELGVKEKIFPREKATVVWNGSTGGVELSKFNFSNREKWREDVRRSLGIDKDDFVFGFAGRITKDKGINEIFEAFKSCNGAKLLLVGTDEEIDTLDRKLVAEAKVNPNIIFHGFVTDIEKYFAAMDVLILPSYREGFGNIVIEAAAVGTPAIVSNIPGPTDAIDEGKTAFVVTVKSAQSLTEKMQEIMKVDYVSMGGKAALFVAEKFDSEKLNERILDRKKQLLEALNKCL